MTAFQILGAIAACWLGLLLLAVGLLALHTRRRADADEAAVREACELTLAKVDEHLRRQPLRPGLPGVVRRPSPRPRPVPWHQDPFAVHIEYAAITAGLGDVRAAAAQIESSGEEE